MLQVRKEIVARSVLIECEAERLNMAGRWAQSILRDGEVSTVVGRETPNLPRDKRHLIRVRAMISREMIIINYEYPSLKTER